MSVMKAMRTDGLSGDRLVDVFRESGTEKDRGGWGDSQLMCQED